MAGQRDIKRVLTACLGGIWLLDGILQLQPTMFTSGFVNTVLLPVLQNQPRALGSIIDLGIRIFSLNGIWCNLGAALIQVLIGVALLLPFRGSIRRFGLWLSVAWAFVVWIFGEGFGMLFTGSATFYTGAPGSALLYIILALFLIFSCAKWLPLAAAGIFLLGAALNCMPMFWRPSMLSMLAMVPGMSGALGAIGARGTVVGNLIAVDALIIFGILLILTPNRPVAWATIAFLFVVWGLGQDFGALQTFPGGVATDPNSAPLLALFLLPIFFNARNDVDASS
jgi:hypothetical protein